MCPQKQPFHGAVISKHVEIKKNYKIFWTYDFSSLTTTSHFHIFKVRGATLIDNGL